MPNALGLGARVARSALSQPPAAPRESGLVARGAQDSIVMIAADPSSPSGGRAGCSRTEPGTVPNTSSALIDDAIASSACRISVWTRASVP